MESLEDAEDATAGLRDLRDVDVDVQVHVGSCMGFPCRRTGLNEGFGSDWMDGESRWMMDGLTSHTCFFSSPLLFSDYCAEKRQSGFVTSCFESPISAFALCLSAACLPALSLHRFAGNVSRCA